MPSVKRRNYVGGAEVLLREADVEPVLMALRSVAYDDRQMDKIEREVGNSAAVVNVMEGLQRVAAFDKPEKKNPSRAYVEALFPSSGVPEGERYGWIITKDHIYESDEDPDAKEIRNDTGTIGPRDVPEKIVAQLRAGKGKAFRMLDDDRNLYYTGRYIGPDDETMFAPLEDFGLPNAGAVHIQYREGGKWADL